MVLKKKHTKQYVVHRAALWCMVAVIQMFCLQVLHHHGVSSCGELIGGLDRQHGEEHLSSDCVVCDYLHTSFMASSMFVLSLPCEYSDEPDVRWDKTLVNCIVSSHQGRAPPIR